MLSNNRRARPWTWAVLLFTLLAVVAGCKKPDNDYGTDLLPDGQALAVVTVDTLSLLGYTIKDDSLRTSQLSRNMLGSYLDRDFGIVSASIATQYLLSSNNVGIGVDPLNLEVDSIVLSFEYDTPDFGYGDVDAQVFHVYELDTLLDPDSVLYNTTIAPVKGNDLVYHKGQLIKPRPTEFAFVGGDTLLPQLRIRLEDEFGRRLLDQWGSPNLSDNASFTDYFNGLLIGVDNSNATPFERGVLYFDMLDADTKMTLYYADNTPGSEEDSLSFDFVINSGAARFTSTKFDHNAALTPHLSMALMDSTIMDRLYVQAGGGLRSVVVAPYVDDLVGIDLTALSKVELVMPLDEAYYPFYAPADQLFLFRTGDEGQDLIIPDQNGINDGGQLGLLDMDAGEYRFIITRYFQGLLNGEFPNTGLQVVSGNSGVSVNRTLIHGPAHPTEPMRIVLTFTAY